MAREVCQGSGMQMTTHRLTLTALCPHCQQFWRVRCDGALVQHKAVMAQSGAV
jgi:hypothetical protein